ncbi:hypothetical protein RBB73_12775 [Tunturiibacter empetritectus]
MNSRSALVTYTTNNTSHIERLIYGKIGHVPPHLTISTWYSFPLRHMVRPYQRSLYPLSVKRLHFHNGISAQYSKETDIGAHYFTGDGCIFVDKVSKFACQVIKKTDGKPIRRLEDIFKHLYIDEVQDLAGWDLDLIETLMKSRIGVTLVGDLQKSELAPPYWGNLARAASWSTCFLIIDEPPVKIDSNLQEHVVFFCVRRG